MEEIWKDIVGYEGLYQVSTLGRVKASERLYIDALGRRVLKKERVLASRISSQTGYPSINLSKNDVVKTHSIHRLVAEAFIPNPKGLPCINHKDESRDNNCVENLEWCTYAYNNSYGTAPKRRNANIIEYWKTHDKEPQYRPGKHVIQYTLNGEKVREFISIGEAERELGVGNSSGISACCNRKAKTAYGFVWRFEDDKFLIDEYKPKRHQKYVIKRDMDGNEVARYKSASEAARVNGFDRHKLMKEEPIDGFIYEVEKKENEFIPTGHKGPRPDLVGRNTKTVYQYTKDGQFVAEYKSIKDAAIAMGDRKRSSDITNCAKGNIPSAFGFDWRYKKKQTWK